MRILGLLLALMLAVVPVRTSADPVWWPNANNLIQVQVTANITTATTTLIFTCPAGFNCWIFYVGAYPTGTNTTDFVAWKTGGNATCSSGTIVSYNAQAVNAPAATGANPVALWGSVTNLLNSIPTMIPPGSSACGVTSGTTIAIEFQAEEIQTPI